MNAYGTSYVTRGFEVTIEKRPAGYYLASIWNPQNGKWAKRTYKTMRGASNWTESYVYKQTGVRDSGW